MNTKVITGSNTLLSYANLFEPKAPIGGGKAKYSVSAVFKKSDTKTVEAVKKAIQAAYTDGESKLKGNSKVAPALSEIRSPLRDGDKERPGDPVYEGCYFINCSSDNAPEIVDGELNPIISRNDCYSGCKGRVSINFFAYNTNGNKGIGAGLNNVQVLRKGTPLGGKSRAEDDFAGLEDDSDDSTDGFLD